MLQDEVITPASEQSWFSSFPNIDDTMDWHHLRTLVTEPHDPVADLATATCPFLAIFGGLDALLPPWTSAEDIGSALTAAGNSDASVVVFPGVDHRIQDPATGQLAAGYLEALGDWTARRALL